ncbi:MAG: WxcM-like domain-containing protein [archaeon]
MTEIERFGNNLRVIEVLLKNSDLKEKEFGQLYLIEIMPGVTTGNHYHKNKDEWLIPINGEIKVYLEDVVSKQREELVLNSNNLDKKILIQPNIAHATINQSGKPVMLVEYSTKPFDPNKEDRIVYKVC